MSSAPTSGGGAVCLRGCEGEQGEEGVHSRRLRPTVLTVAWYGRNGDSGERETRCGLGKYPDLSYLTLGYQRWHRYSAVPVDASDLYRVGYSRGRRRGRVWQSCRKANASFWTCGV